MTIKRTYRSPCSAVFVDDVFVGRRLELGGMPKVAASVQTSSSLAGRGAGAGRFAGKIQKLGNPRGVNIIGAV